ncbi:MAG TPA: hypothetical protein VE343_02140 [Streptosporangiaceae bacterium]|nr:hypothetical protein [Streptosporangiaceae bacterium]
MASEWLGAGFTALGAAIGAGASFGSVLITNRAQRGLAADTRKDQVAEVRRTAYAEYLTVVYSFMDRSRELIAKIETDAGTQACDAARRDYLEDWDRLQPVYAPVLIAGPSEIEKSAERLRFCLGDLADECDKCNAVYKDGDRSGPAKSALRAQQRARDARLEFASAARNHVFG